MHLHAYCLPTATLHRYIHIYACIEMTTSSHPLNVLMSICGGGGGGDIDHRVGTAASLLLRVDSWMTDLKAMMVMRICVMLGRRVTYRLHMYTQRQRTTGPKQKNKWDQDRSPITGNNHSKSIEGAGGSQSKRYTWRVQPQRHALRHLTIINMFFFKTYIACTIWSEIAIRKGSLSLINVDCSTLQTSRPNHPTTYTYTNTHTNNSQSMHACIHSFIQSTIFTLSLFHKNEPSITTAIHHNLQSSIHQSSTMHCTDHSVGQSYMHAWCCHDSHTMERNCMRIPLANHHLTQIRTYMHACMHV